MDAFSEFKKLEDLFSKLVSVVSDINAFNVMKNESDPVVSEDSISHPDKSSKQLRDVSFVASGNKADSCDNASIESKVISPTKSIGNSTDSHDLMLGFDTGNRFIDNCTSYKDTGCWNTSDDVMKSNDRTDAGYLNVSEIKTSGDEGMKSYDKIDAGYLNMMKDQALGVEFPSFSDFNEASLNAILRKVRSI
ncbi:hypothetical protein Bhyg_03351, partial [Pseudolycoriella hygida]